MSDCLSVEKGVLISRKGLCSRCLEIRDSLARGVARVKDVRGPRQKTIGRNAARSARVMFRAAAMALKMLVNWRRGWPSWIA